MNVEICQGEENDTQRRAQALGDRERFRLSVCDDDGADEEEAESEGPQRVEDEPVVGVAERGDARHGARDGAERGHGALVRGRRRQRFGVVESIEHRHRRHGVESGLERGGHGGSGGGAPDGLDREDPEEHRGDERDDCQPERLVLRRVQDAQRVREARRTLIELAARPPAHVDPDLPRHDACR